MKTLKPRKFKLPHLSFSFRAPLINIHTELFNRSLERQVYEYILVYIAVWKWHWKFELYSPDYQNV